MAKRKKMATTSTDSSETTSVETTEVVQEEVTATEQVVSEETATAVQEETVSTDTTVSEATTATEVVAETVTEVVEEKAVEEVSVATTTTAEVITPTATVVDTAIAAAVSSKNEITTTGKIVLQSIDDYMVNMKPAKPITVADGARNQVALYRTLTQMLNSLNEDFNIVYGTVLQKFHDNRDGVFHETHIYRFFQNITLPENDRRIFQRLVNLIKITADPKGRATALKQVDIGKTIEHLPESAKQKILSFYHM